MFEGSCMIIMGQEILMYNSYFYFRFVMGKFEVLKFISLIRILTINSRGHLCNYQYIYCVFDLKL